MLPPSAFLFTWARARREREVSLFRQLARKWRPSGRRQYDDFVAESFARTRQRLAIYQAARAAKPQTDGPLVWRN